MRYFHNQHRNDVPALLDLISKINSLCRVMARKMCLFIDGWKKRHYTSLHNLCFRLWQVCWFGNKGGLAVFLAIPLFILLMINSGLFASTVYSIWQTRRLAERYIHKNRRDEIVLTSSSHVTDSEGKVNSRDKGSNLSGR